MKLFSLAMLGPTLNIGLALGTLLLGLLGVAFLLLALSTRLKLRTVPIRMLAAALLLAAGWYVVQGAALLLVAAPAVKMLVAAADVLVIALLLKHNRSNQQLPAYSTPLHSEA